MRPFLPLLDPRDVLIVLEVLSFGIKYPDLIVFTSARRALCAANFRKEILFRFTEALFIDICQVMFVSPKNRQDIIAQIALRLAQEIYTSEQLNYGHQWLDASILASLGEICTCKADYMHWRLYFAKLLLEQA